MAHDTAQPATAGAPHASETVDEKSHYHAHVVSMPVLIATFVALLILTVLTVAAINIQLGPTGNIALALIIALVKASIVALYFMHLRYDSIFNSIILIAALLFVVIFIVVSLIDTADYHPERAEYQRTQQQAEGGG